MMHSSSPVDDEIHLRTVTRTLKRATGFQHDDRIYGEMLRDSSEAVRLEVLSYAVDDIIQLRAPDLRRILDEGTDLERRYALLVLARNGQTTMKEIAESHIGDDDYAGIWKNACEYAIDPTMSGMLRISLFITDEDLSRASLSLNLCVTVANAVHRVILYDILRVILESSTSDKPIAKSISQAMRDLQLNKSWSAIKRYTFAKTEIARLLS